MSAAIKARLLRGLGQNDATASKSNAAYRQIALKWHPTAIRRWTPPINSAKSLKPTRFCPTRRSAAYDATGHAGVSERWSTEDIFRDFDFGDFFGGRFADLGSILYLLGSDAAERRQAPLADSLRPPPTDEAARGGGRVIHISRLTLKLRPVAALPGTKPVTCTDCRGTGEQQQVRSEKSMRVITSRPAHAATGGEFSRVAVCRLRGGVVFLLHAIKVHPAASTWHAAASRPRRDLYHGRIAGRPAREFIKPTRCSNGTATIFTRCCR